MNLVLDDAQEIYVKKKTRKPLGISSSFSRHSMPSICARSHSDKGRHHHLDAAIKVEGQSDRHLSVMSLSKLP